MNSNTRDRYVSFEGLECDDNAIKIVDTIRDYVSRAEPADRWRKYFEMKFTEQQQMNVDDLFYCRQPDECVLRFFH